jgi:hypothetical protein
MGGVFEARRSLGKPGPAQVSAPPFLHILCGVIALARPSGEYNWLGAAVIVEKTHRGSELDLFRSKLEKDVGGGPRGGGRAAQSVGVFKTRNKSTRCL